MKSLRNLAQTQRLFKDLILKPELAVPRGLLALPNVQAKGAAQLADSEKLQIYVLDFRTRMVDTLKNTFSHVFNVIGEKEFSYWVKDYAQIHPSQSYDLGVWGQAFPEYVKTNHKNHQYPFLADLARLEWLEVISIHQRVLAAVNPQMLFQRDLKDWGGLSFGLQPSLNLCQTAYFLEPVFSGNADYNAIELKETHWVLWQDENGFVHRDILDAAAWRVVDKLQKGVCLQEALSEEPAMTPDQVQSLFQTLFEKQWVVQILE